MRALRGHQVPFEIVHVPSERARRRRELAQLGVRELDDERGERVARGEDHLAGLVGAVRAPLLRRQERAKLLLQFEAPLRGREQRRGLLVHLRERARRAGEAELGCLAREAERRERRRSRRAARRSRLSTLGRKPCVGLAGDAGCVRPNLREGLACALLELPARIDPLVRRLTGHLGRALRRLQQRADEDLEAADGGWRTPGRRRLAERDGSGAAVVAQGSTDGCETVC